MRLVLAPLVLAAAVAQAQVDCSDPDNLCTGDPCTIASSIEVGDLCVVDFGSRALVVTGAVHAPRSSLVSFTAGSITVSGLIEATDRTDFFFSGGDIVLAATGDVTVSGRLNVSRQPGFAGTITLDAGGDVRVRGRLDASGMAAGDVTIDAGADVEITRPVKARGGQGAIAVTAGGDIVVDGSLLAHTRAPAGGQGGQVTLLAGGTVLVRDPIRVASTGCGPTVVVRGALGVTVERVIDARALCQVDVEVSSSGGDVTIANRIDAGTRSTNSIGTIRLDAAGALSVAGSLSARGASNPGGAVFARGATVSLARNVDVRGEPGGTIEGTATGNLTASGTFRAVPNGCIALIAGGTLDTNGATFAPPLVSDCPGSPSGAFLD